MEKEEDKHIRKRHSVSYILYHIVCPVKYRRNAIHTQMAQTIKVVCFEISKRYEINFVEIGTDDDHVHFLVQSIPALAPSNVVQIIKSIVAKQIFYQQPEVKRLLWGGQFWSSGYYVNTVGRYGNEQVISNYVKNQGKNYQRVYRGQLTLFE